MFGVGEIIANLAQPAGEPLAGRREKITRLWPTREDFRRAWPAVLRGTALGSVLGVLPGGGATLSAFAAYALEKKSPRTRRASATARSRASPARNPPTMPARRPRSSRC